MKFLGKNLYFYIIKKVLVREPFLIWEQVDATRTGVNEEIYRFLILLIAIDNGLKLIVIFILKKAIFDEKKTLYS